LRRTSRKNELLASWSAATSTSRIGLLLTPTLPAAAATVSFAFDSSLLYAEPGDIVGFSGTLTNTGVAPVFLNSDSITFPVGSIDDSPFFALPASLAPLASASGLLFNITIPSGAALGTYVGTFNVLGGDTPADLDVLASSTFAVTVVPEPSSALLIATVIGALILRRRP
jgi:hypothetical protein